MNLELFIAKKIIQGGGKSFSRPIIRISIVAIALGTTIMTLALSILFGFQREIRQKVVGFGSHIKITAYDAQNVIETPPISTQQDFFPLLEELDGVRHIQAFAHKGAIIKTETDNYGVVIKGVGKDFDWNFFSTQMESGQTLSLPDSAASKELVISQKIAKKLRLSVGDDVILYFVQNPPRVRKLKVSGIYNTGFGEMDDQFVFADIRHLQKVNGWEPTQVGGFEISIEDIDDLTSITEVVHESIGYNLRAVSIVQSRPDIFNWLELQDVNAIIIICLLILVCGIDIVSALLILILERSRMIGILKAIGAANVSIQKIFIYNAAYLIISGLLIGNIIGIGLALAQKHYRFIKLPEEAYYIDTVPIEIDVLSLILLNVGTLLICLLFLILPSFLVARINPVKAIRFD